MQRRSVVDRCSSILLQKATGHSVLGACRKLWVLGSVAILMSHFVLYLMANQIMITKN